MNQGRQSGGAAGLLVGWATTGRLETGMLGFIVFAAIARAVVEHRELDATG